MERAEVQTMLDEFEEMLRLRLGNLEHSTKRKAAMLEQRIEGLEKEIAKMRRTEQE